MMMVGGLKKKKGKLAGGGGKSEKDREGDRSEKELLFLLLLIRFAIRLEERIGSVQKVPVVRAEFGKKVGIRGEKGKKGDSEFVWRATETTSENTDVFLPA